MPIYGYDCEACGPFTEMQAMSRSSEPLPCPDCGASARRTVSAPFIANMDPNNRVAHQRNEKSADEPRVASGKPPGHRHDHPHHHGHKHARPWSLGH